MSRENCILNFACVLSDLAYQDDVSGLRKIDGVGDAQIQCTTIQNPQIGSSCLLASFEIQAVPYLVAAFRGTDAFQDWGYNVSFWKASVAAADDRRFFVPRVHGGFLAQYRSLKIALQEQITQYHHGVNLIITGHSLGGALACVCAHDILSNSARPSDKIRLVTFGCPRPGNYVFKCDLEDKIKCHRVVLGNDCVTYTPILNAFHVGEYHAIGEWSKLPNVADHSIQSYKAALCQQNSNPEQPSRNGSSLW